MHTTQATLAPRASRLAGVITAALLRLGVEREVTTGTDTVIIGDIVLQQSSDPIPIGTTSDVRACVNDATEAALEHGDQRHAFRFAHVHGAERKAAQRLIADLHYSANPGGSGFTHAIHIDERIVAACLIGPTLSKGSEQSLIAPGFPCRLVKRLVARDDCPVPESQLLRMAMRYVANALGLSGNLLC